MDDNYDVPGSYGDRQWHAYVTRTVVARAAARMIDGYMRTDFADWERELARVGGEQ